MGKTGGRRKIGRKKGREGTHITSNAITQYVNATHHHRYTTHTWIREWKQQCVIIEAIVISIWWGAQNIIVKYRRQLAVWEALRNPKRGRNNNNNKKRILFCSVTLCSPTGILGVHCKGHRSSPLTCHQTPPTLQTGKIKSVWWDSLASEIYSRLCWVPSCGASLECKFISDICTPIK